MHPLHFVCPRKAWFLLGLVVGTVLLGAVSVSAQGPNPTPPKSNAPTANPGTAFTYQGRLMNNGAPVNGSCDLKFDLFDAATGGFHTAGPIIQSGVLVTDGLFTTVIDLGANVLIGDARWLHIAVACPSGGSYTALGPRQALTPAPIALSLPGLRTDQSGSSPNIIIHGDDTALQIQSVGSSTFPRTIYTADASEWHTGVGGSTVGNGLNSKYYVYDANAGQTRLVIDASGNVGIGTTGPGAQLEVFAVDPMARIRNSSDAGGAFIGNTFNALQLGLYNPTGSTWGAIPANTKRSIFGLNNNGEVCSLTNSFPGGMACRNTLDDGGGTATINGSAYIGDYPLNHGGLGVGGNEIVNGYLTVGTFDSGGSTSLCKDSQFGSNLIATCSSSLRYKNNIADLQLGLETVMQLRPVTYDWKNNGAHDLGLVAEEVNAVAPILTTYNNDGHIDGVKYDHLTAVLVKGIQEQQQQIAEMTSQNGGLEKKSADLEARAATQQKQIDSLEARLAVLEQASPGAQPQSRNWNAELAFVVGAVAVVVADRARKGSK